MSETIKLWFEEIEKVASRRSSTLREAAEFLCMELEADALKSNDEDEVAWLYASIDTIKCMMMS